MSSPIMMGEALNFDEVELRNKVRNVLLPYLNSVNYFLIYSNKYHFEPEKDFVSEDILDKWINARLAELLVEVSEGLESYHIPRAVRGVEDFVTDLSTWYVRRSRERIVEGDKQALNTMYSVLLGLTKIAAPVIPFLTEYVYKQLVETGSSEVHDSVHLCLLPETKKLSKEQSLILSNMTILRQIVSLTHSLRGELDIPVRQPLALLEVKVSDLDKELLNLIATEVNVKKIELVSDLNNSYKIKEDKDVSVALDINLTKELELEGDLRLLTRKIQNKRKELKLNVGDLIDLVFSQEEEQLIEMFKDEITKKTNVKNYIKGDKLEVVISK